MKRILAALLAAAMVLGLTACGSDPEPAPSATDAAAVTTSVQEESTTEPAAEVPAATQTAGKFSIDVPDGYEFSIGDVFDEKDERVFRVKKDSFHYLEFHAEGEERNMKHYENNKNTYTNEQVDFETVYQGMNWTGFQYSDGYGGYGFEAYAAIDGENIRVSSAGYKYDDPAVAQIMGSIKNIAGPAETPAETTAEAQTPAETQPEATREAGEKALMPRYIGYAVDVVGIMPIEEVYPETETYLLINDDGTGTSCLDGIETPMTWTLSGEDFTMTIGTLESPGTVKDGIIRLTYLDMMTIYYYDAAMERPVLDTEEEDTTQAPEDGTTEAATEEESTQAGTVDPDKAAFYENYAEHVEAFRFVGRNVRMTEYMGGVPFVMTSADKMTQVSVDEQYALMYEKDGRLYVEVCINDAEGQPSDVWYVADMEEGADPFSDMGTMSSDDLESDPTAVELEYLQTVEQNGIRYDLVRMTNIAPEEEEDEEAPGSAVLWIDDVQQEIWKMVIEATDAMTGEPVQAEVEFFTFDGQYPEPVDPQEVSYQDATVNFAMGMMTLMIGDTNIEE